MSAHEELSDLKSILIVEDNPELIELLKDLMDEAQYEIVSTAEAKNGHALMVDRRFDLLICDLHLPGMSGIELLKLCKNENILPKKVIVISGDIQHLEDQPELMTHLVCLEKPFVIEEFRSTLKKLLG